MSQSDHPATRNFFCDHCGGEIQVPFDLPPTTAPCPFCRKDITSPAPPVPERPVGPEGGDPLRPGPPEVVEEPAAPDKEPESREAVAETVSVATAREVSEGSGREPVEDLVGEAATEPAPAKEERKPAVDLTDRKSPDEPVAPAAPLPKRSAWPSILFLLAALVLAGLVVLGVYLVQSGQKPVPPGGMNRVIDNNQFIRDGWKAAATERLRGFLGAKSLEEKARHVVGGTDKLEEMKEFYRTHPLDEADMPLDAFSHFMLSLEDRQAGVFLMRYERPAQFDIREFFRPVAPLEVKYNVEEGGLLLRSVAALENFAMDPVHALVFFKRDGDQLLIDWDTYVQTKYRTLRDFVSLPQPGRKAVFRVQVQEDLPGFAGGAEGGGRVYRLTDPAQPADYVKVQVKEDSSLGLVLSEVNWIGVEGAEMPNQTATVELSWSEGDSPVVELADFICWDFIGLLGEEGGSAPVPGTTTEPEEATPPAS